MSARKKTWAEKLSGGSPPKIVVTDKEFAGIPVGTSMLVASPRAVDEAIRSLPAGTAMNMKEFREVLAKQHKAQACCPLSTAIFVRIAAEAAWDGIEQGQASSAVTPFWRVVEPGSSLAKKLRADSAWIAHQRDMEQARRA